MIRSIPTEFTDHSKTPTDGVSSSDMLGGTDELIDKGSLGRVEFLCEL